MTARRTAKVMLLAFAFGVLAAIVKGQSGGGVSVLSGVRAEIGNLSAPWVLVAWVAGSRTTRLPMSALLGLGATAVALVGFYVVSGLVEPGGRTVVQGMGSWFSANRVYFEAGLLSGPVFGLLGGWWARRRSPRPAIVAGLLLLGEPIVLALTGAILPNGVLSPHTGLPLVVRIVPGFALSAHRGRVSVAVHAVEVVAGLALVAYPLWRRAPRSTECPPVLD